MGKVRALGNLSTFNRRTAQRVAIARKVRRMSEEAANHDVSGPELLRLYRQAVRNALVRNIPFALE